VLTFDQLAQDFPEAEFIQIMGVDSFLTLDRWVDVDSVVKHTTYAVAGRRGSGLTEVDGLRRRLGVLGEDLRVKWFDFDTHAGASSKAIREQLAAGDRPAAVAGRVYEYIQAHGLYL